jgi:hypothetical protein
MRLDSVVLPLTRRTIGRIIARVAAHMGVRAHMGVKHVKCRELISSNHVLTVPLLASKNHDIF